MELIIIERGRNKARKMNGNSSRIVNNTAKYSMRQMKGGMLEVDGAGGGKSKMMGCPRKSYP